MSKKSSAKVSSKRTATLASKALKSDKTSKLTKSLAGAVLAQANNKKK